MPDQWLSFVQNMLIPELCPPKIQLSRRWGGIRKQVKPLKINSLKTNTVIFVRPQCEDQKEFLSNRIIFLL